MSLIIDAVLKHLPSKRKHSSGGWTSFCAPCCIHNGTTVDTRFRGGILTNNGISYHCFNCGFKASWQPGKALSIKFKRLLTWLGVPEQTIARCVFEALASKDSDSTLTVKNAVSQDFITRSLPADAKPIESWITESNNLDPELLSVIEYLVNRGYSLDDYDWYWSSDPKFNNRLIIPFKYQQRTVGYTARLCAKHSSHKKIPKYISEQPQGYVFNLDKQHWNKSQVFVTEGPLDAVFLDGVAVMSNEISSVQRQMIENLNKPIVVVPDRDSAGLKMIQQAVEWGWQVSMPEWPENVKDLGEAVVAMGKLAAVWSVVSSIEHSPIKIKIKTQQLYKK